MVLQTNLKTHVLFESCAINNQYNRYADYLSTLDLANETIDWRLKHIRGFLKDIDDKTFDFSSLKIEDIYNYLSSIEHLSSRTREHRGVCIRKFLNWLHNEGIIPFDGNRILPKIKCNKRESIISFYTVSEINKMINAAANNKRDFAVLLLCSFFGMRSKDIVNLKFENIDWDNNKINFICSKNNYPMSLMMPDDLRYALIDYIKNERSVSKINFIFLRNNGTPMNDHTLYSIINKYFKKANINTEGKRHGSHSIRHSLAVSLLDNKKSLYEIASVLGHINVNDSKIYATVDINEFKKISLEVPEWKI